MLPIHDDTGALIGVTIHSTTYSAEALERLASRLERAEALLEQARAVMAQGEEVIALLNEQVSDRDRDLEYEYSTRCLAEAWAARLADLAHSYGQHYLCSTIDGRSPCDCGYLEALTLAKAAQEAYTKEQGTPHARIVALGRATLAYEQARATRNAEGRDAGTEAALRAVGETRRAYLAALAEAMGHAAGRVEEG